MVSKLDSDTLAPNCFKLSQDSINPCCRPIELPARPTSFGIGSFGELGPGRLNPRPPEHVVHGVAKMWQDDHEPPSGTNNHRRVCAGQTHNAHEAHQQPLSVPRFPWYY